MPSSRQLSTADILAELGRNIRGVRVQRGLEQAELAERAGISISALSHLENGHGSALQSFVRVLRALDLADGLNTLVPGTVFDPLSVNRAAAPRQRVRYSRARPPASGNQRGRGEIAT
jgi:transcriptional regulator with XRE-family HTH domain